MEYLGLPGSSIIERGMGEPKEPSLFSPPFPAQWGKRPKPNGANCTLREARVLTVEVGIAS